jgi:hypothetical protein
MGKRGASGVATGAGSASGAGRGPHIGCGA